MRRGAYFLDTSALAKRYLPERGSDWVDRACTSANVSIWASALAATELASALRRRYREGAMSAEVRDTVYRQFLADSVNYELIGVSEDIVDDAARLLLSGPEIRQFRGIDAIQLATALRWRSLLDASSESAYFVVSDERLRAAAEGMALMVIDPEREEQA
jgi:predicted nucleic acid-binding protein